MEISIIRDLNGFSACAAAWNELLRLNGNQSYYMTPDWITSWWEFFGGGLSLYILMLSDRGETLGFLPLMTQKKRFITEFRCVGHPQSVRSGFLVRPGYEDSVVSALIAHLRCVPGTAIFRLSGFGKDDPCFIRLMNELSDAKPVVKILPFYYINLKESGQEAYFKKARSHKTLKKSFNLEQTLDKLLPLSFKAASPEEIELIFPLHEKRWSQKNDGNGFGKGVSKRFFTYLAQSGNPSLVSSPSSFQTCVYLLRAGRHLIGFAYGFICNGHLAFYRIAHDNDFGLFRSGMIVTKRLLEQCFALNLDSMDFSTGDEPYKLLWADKSEDICQVTFGTKAKTACAAMAASRWKNSLRLRLKSNEKLVNFKRITLGRIKYVLSGAFAAHFIKKARLILSRRSAADLLGYMAKKAAEKFYRANRYQLYVVVQSPKKPAILPGLSVRPAALDDLALLNGLMILPADQIVRRYKNGERCCLFYEAEKMIGYAWIGKTQIGNRKRVFWKAESSCDRCVYDICLFKPLDSAARFGILHCLARESAASTDMKNARIYFLISRPERNLIRAADKILKRTAGSAKPAEDKERNDHKNEKSDD